VSCSPDGQTWAPMLLPCSPPLPAVPVRHRGTPELCEVRGSHHQALEWWRLWALCYSTAQLLFSVPPFWVPLGPLSVLHLQKPWSQNEPQSVTAWPPVCVLGLCTCTQLTVGCRSSEENCMCTFSSSSLRSVGRRRALPVGAPSPLLFVDRLPSSTHNCW
jgi:hypothetical protein